MRGSPLLGFLLFYPLFLQWGILSYGSVAAQQGTWYDYTAYTECKRSPEAALYRGGVIKEGADTVRETTVGSSSPAFVLLNLTATTIYSFSCWVKINRGADSALLKARLSTGDGVLNCIGSSVVKRHCWSFLKGGFVLDTASQTSLVFFQNADGKPIDISLVSASLQPFSAEEWEMHRNNSISRKRKRAVAIHVSDAEGNPVSGASVSVEQIAKDFPFGSAIAKTILGNSKYQDWFVERFNAAVFENELKWYATEPEPGRLNYTVADAMLRFVHAHHILVRGHNIFWEDPRYTPAWVRNLSSADELRSAVSSRITGLLSRYKGDFVHWDVSNEMLHFDFYERRLGNTNASLEFFAAARAADPLATLFMNDFNVVETCDDVNSTVDDYVARLRELMRGGAANLEGIGLEGHFSKPNLPLIRAVLDKLSTLHLPIWLTEVDISKTFDRQTQAKYLEGVLREGFSHPGVNGIMLWSALHPNVSCYQMCLTDDDLENLPAGDVVDRLLNEWETKWAGGETNDHGIFSFVGFLGEYMVSATYGNRTSETTLSLSQGDETSHLNIQLQY
ncbi:hypothetical protein HPP92_004627 [Vanilla planifolia]|uniref:GH10 domain-containing protein n=1 Tax=Vanilla planifolia TaxID=51239 RepID=A0A835RHV5_VANPL|nr:hypothetical protein HPP92_004982 [Vanilla planifolia]KAG0493633.1 hypothetical protein HPP92_004627 [Vanilla planifolia]